MAENRYGKKSMLRLGFHFDRGRSVMSDAAFTAPFKVTRPFYGERGKIVVMILSVSAGLMAGDSQDAEINVGQGAFAEITSQSFEKIHRMSEGFAERRVRLSVSAGGTLIYAPLPVIPFRGSAFRGGVSVELAGPDARICLSDILSCGRASRGERHEYREYRSLVTARERGALIYRDNSVFIPDETSMDGLCAFEGYTHLSNMLLLNFDVSDELFSAIKDAVMGLRDGVGGVTRAASGGVCARALANGSEPLINLHAEIRDMLKI
jgi:urease accessory protein